MVTSLLLGMVFTSAVQDSAILHNTFDRGVEGWAAMHVNGAGAKVDATYDKVHLKSGPGSLDYSYKIANGEHDGGRYSAVCHVPKAHWQEVNLSPSDFILATEPDAPKDPDGKLDVDKVESIALIDLEGFLAQNGMLVDLLGLNTGPRHLYVSDVQAVETKLEDQSTNGSNGYQIDLLTRPQLSWLGFGMEGISVSNDSPFKGTWLKLDYHVGAGHINGVVKSVKPECMVGKSKLVFSGGATRATQLFVQIEQTDGSKFRTTIEVPGQAHYNQFDLPFASFTVTEDSPNKDAKLEIGKVKQIVLLDVSGMTGGGDGDNTLYISPVTVK